MNHKPLGLASRPRQCFTIFGSIGDWSPGKHWELFVEKSTRKVVPNLLVLRFHGLLVASVTTLWGFIDCQFRVLSCLRSPGLRAG